MGLDGIPKLPTQQQKPAVEETDFIEKPKNEGVLEGSTDTREKELLAFVRELGYAMAEETDLSSVQSKAMAKELHDLETIFSVAPLKVAGTSLTRIQTLLRDGPDIGEYIRITKAQPLNTESKGFTNVAEVEGMPYDEEVVNWVRDREPYKADRAVLSALNEKFGSRIQEALDKLNPQP